jgi:hypothetical protein
MMRLKLLLATLAVLPAGTLPAAAADCPVKPAEMDGIIAAVKAAPSCDTSMKIFEACQFGSTADVQFGDAVEKKCEAQFLSLISTSRKRVYEDQLGRCDEKFADKQGTMWRSATAMCRAGISQRYARRLGK